MRPAVVCGRAVAGVTARGLEPSAFELIDRHCLAAVNEWKHTGLPQDAAALLLARTDLPEPAAEVEASAIREEFEKAGGGPTQRRVVQELLRLLRSHDLEQVRRAHDGLLRQVAHPSEDLRRVRELLRSYFG